MASRKGATKHKLLTEAIIADIEGGVLPPRTRMPTHRDLAHQIGLSVQTVSIGYKEAERRGYLTGEVGRGTFVRDRATERSGRFMLDRSPGDAADLSTVRATYTEAHEAASRALLAALAEEDNSAFMRPCRPVAGLDAHRETAVGWLAGLQVAADPNRILVTNGAAHGLFLAVATVVRRGDLVLTERLTDHGIIGLSSLLGFTLRGLPTDGEGVLPDAFEAACREAPVTALAVVPSLGNPTSHLAGAERRRALAAVAHRHGVFVIEDEVYKPLVEEALPSFADLLPGLGFFVTSFTKAVLTGLRTGYLVVPPQFGIRAASILRMTGWSATYVVAEMAARWVRDGTAGALVAIQRREARARQAILKEVLAPHVLGTHPLSLCAWLRAPPYWTEDALVRQLARRGVAVTPSDPFVVGPDKPEDGGIRVCLGGRLSHANLRAALETVRDTFDQLPPFGDAHSML